MHGLSYFLNQVKDYRRKQGQRFPLPSFLTMVILSNMSGFHSLNALARFFDNNSEYFCHIFKLNHGVPGYTQIRTILKQLDFESLNYAFYNWASQFVDQDDEWLSFDGKGLNSTYTNHGTSQQNFHAMVSAFVQKTGISLSSKQYENKKESEISTAIDLVNQLQQKGMILTFDALHCQKKRSKPSWSLEMTT